MQEPKLLYNFGDPYFTYKGLKGSYRRLHKDIVFTVKHWVASSLLPSVRQRISILMLDKRFHSGSELTIHPVIDRDLHTLCELQSKYGGEIQLVPPTHDLGVLVGDYLGGYVTLEYKVALEDIVEHLCALAAQPFLFSGDKSVRELAAYCIRKNTETPIQGGGAKSDRRT